MAFPLTRPSLGLWVQSGVTVCSPASTWAAQTPSWWYARLLSMSGKLWCPTRPALFVRSCPPSSPCCWASWPPPAPTRGRYGPFLLGHTVTFMSLIAQAHLEGSTAYFSLFSWVPFNNTILAIFCSGFVCPSSSSRFLLLHPCWVVPKHFFPDNLHR